MNHSEGSMDRQGLLKRMEQHIQNDDDSLRQHEHYHCNGDENYLCGTIDSSNDIMDEMQGRMDKDHWLSTQYPSGNALELPNGQGWIKVQKDGKDSMKTTKYDLHPNLGLPEARYLDDHLPYEGNPCLRHEIQSANVHDDNLTFENRNDYGSAGTGKTVAQSIRRTTSLPEGLRTENVEPSALTDMLMKDRHSRDIEMPTGDKMHTPHVAVNTISADNTTKNAYTDDLPKRTFKNIVKNMMLRKSSITNKSMANEEFREDSNHEALASTALGSNMLSRNISAHKNDPRENLMPILGTPKANMKVFGPELNVTMKHNGDSNQMFGSQAQNVENMTGQKDASKDETIHIKDDKTMTGLSANDGSKSYKCNVKKLDKCDSLNIEANMKTGSYDDKYKSLNPEANIENGSNVNVKDANDAQKHKFPGMKIDMRNPDIYIPPMPSPNEVRKQYLKNDDKEYGKINDLINRYESTYLSRRNTYMMILTMKNQHGLDQFYSTGIDHLKEINEDLITLHRQIQGLSKKVDTNQDDEYIEMPNFGSSNLVNMKELQALPKFNPDKSDITLHQFWMKITQFINITKTSEDTAKGMLVYLLEGRALDIYEMSKDKSVKQILLQLKDSFGGMPTKLDYEEQMLKFSRNPKESIRCAMNRYEYIIKKLYMNENDMEHVVELKCKETLKKIAYPEAKEGLIRAEMEARANGSDMDYKAKLKVVSMEEDIIKKRDSISKEACFMQTIKHDPGYYHPRGTSYITEVQGICDGDYDCLDGLSETELDEPRSNDGRKRPRSPLEINTYGYDYVEDDTSDEDFSENETSEEEDDDTHLSPVEAQINSLLQYVRVDWSSEPDIGQKEEHEINKQDNIMIRKLSDKVPHGMVLNTLLKTNSTSPMYYRMEEETGQFLH